MLSDAHDAKRAVSSGEAPLSIFISPMCVPTKQRERRIGQRQGRKHILLSGESGPLEVLGEADSHIATESVTKDGRFSDDEVTG